MKRFPRSKEWKEGGRKEMTLNRFSAKQRAKISQDILEEDRRACSIYYGA